MADFSIISESGFDINRGPTVGMLTVSILSMLSSLLILITGVLLPYQWNKTYMKIIYYIAIADFLTALGSSVGTPHNRSSSCYFEALVTNIFTLSSVFWCVIISYLLYYIVAKGKSFPVDYKMHIVCWGFPVVVTLLPFINTNYGGVDDDGGSWCFIVDDDRSGSWDTTIWFWLAYYLWIWLSIIFILAINCIVMYKAKYQLKEETKIEVNAAIKKMVGYPLVIVLVWAVSTAYDTLTVLFPGKKFEGYAVMKWLSTVYPCSQGFFIALVFFYVLNDVRRDSLEVLREMIKTGKWKVGEQKKRRKQTLFSSSSSRKVVVDDLSSFRTYTVDEPTVRSLREATINDRSDLNSSAHIDESVTTTVTVTAGELKLEDI